MEKSHIINEFRKFYGASAWAAKKLNVRPATVSQWLRGKKTSARLDTEMPRLAAELKESDGKCISDVNGPSLRSQINRIRRGK